MPKQIHIVTRTFRCPRRLSLEIDYVADRNGCHASDIIREAVQKFLADQLAASADLRNGGTE